MRPIQISTDVFQAIWASRQLGEEDEDAILRRLLNAGGKAGESPPSVDSGGVTDSSYGVHFPEGFEVFRTYLGREYRARVVNGRWVIDGKRVPGNTINQLSAAIGVMRENGWANWEYKDSAGTTHKIGNLRDPAKIRRRRRAMF